MLNLKNYNFELDSLIISNGQVQASIWLHQSLVYSYKKIMEDKTNPRVAMKVGFLYAKKINIISYFFQWQKLQNVQNDKKKL